MKKELILSEEMYEKLKESLFRISIQQFRVFIQIETDSNLGKQVLVGFLIDSIEKASIKIKDLRNSLNE